MDLSEELAKLESMMLASHWSIFYISVLGILNDNEGQQHNAKQGCECAWVPDSRTCAMWMYSAIYKPASVGFVKVLTWNCHVLLHVFLAICQTKPRSSLTQILKIVDWLKVKGLGLWTILRVVATPVPASQSNPIQCLVEVGHKIPLVNTIQSNHFVATTFS